jgi:hypothetical protein
LKHGIGRVKGKEGSWKGEWKLDKLVKEEGRNEDKGDGEGGDGDKEDCKKMDI